MVYEVLKGTKDLEPSEQIKVNFILDVIRKNFEAFGFRPFDTPTIEYFETLANKYDEDAEIVQEIFKVQDRGNRNLGLRYDLTVPLCRYVASKKQLKLPFRRYAIGKVFRDGPLKKGRLREFIQCDGDVVGVKGVFIEAELLEMFFRTYSEIGVDAVIEINNNKILRGVLLQCGFEEKDLSSLILSVDKLKKIGEGGVLAEVVEKGFDEKNMKKALKMFALEKFVELKKEAKNDILKQGIEELENLVELIEKRGVKFRVNFSMSRGLDIYTGNIWEAYDLEENVSSSIGSGGRYDRVIGNYMESDVEYPALGVSFGVVPILAVLDEKLGSKEGTADILVVPLDETAVFDAMVIADKFRNKMKNVEMFYGFKLKKAFDYAQYLGCDEIIILGKKDMEKQEFTVKNIVTGEETKVSYK